MNATAPSSTTQTDSASSGNAGDNVSLTLERLIIMPSNDELAAWIEAFDVPDDHGIRSRTVAHVSPRTGLTNRYGQVKLSWIERQPIINR